MDSRLILPNRRQVMQITGAGLAVAAMEGFYTTPGLFAEELMKTPTQTEGPFYPDRLPLDTDNDLLVINDSITPAVGAITHLTGKVTDVKGKPVRNAVVEIWQCDGKGVYLHSKGGDKSKDDENFQGFGRFVTDHKGQYYFRTIKPVPYPGRTPHIHFAVNIGSKRILTTQCYVNGHELNVRDGVMRSIPNAKIRNLLMVDFKKMKDSKIGEMTANFDIVLGQTPDDDILKKKKA